MLDLKRTHSKTPVSTLPALLRIMLLTVRESVPTLDPSEVPRWVSVTSSRHYFQLATVTILVYEISKSRLLICWRIILTVPHC